MDNKDKGTGSIGTPSPQEVTAIQRDITDGTNCTFLKFETQQKHGSLKGTWTIWEGNSYTNFIYKWARNCWKFLWDKRHQQKSSAFRIHTKLSNNQLGDRMLYT